MTAFMLAQLGHSYHRPHGWVVSLLLHGIVLLGAVVVFSELKPIIKSEPFRWEISLAQNPQVQAEPPTPVPPQPKPVVQPEPVPAKPVEAKPVVRQVQTVQRVEAVHQVVRQELQTVQHRANPVIESLAQHVEAIHQESQPAQNTEVVQSVTAMAMPNPVMQEVQTAPSIIPTQVETDSPAPVVTQEAVVAQSSPAPIHQSSVTQQPTMEASAVTVETAAPVQQVAHTATVQTQGTERPAPITTTTKADYSWLTQELLSRLERSKRYPYTARMNRWEGKVLVRAVVRDDGAVVSIQIAESSGHTVLDNDAMELIRQISPIHLKHPLGKTQVALLVPVGYSLH